MNKDLIALTEGAQKKSSSAKLRRRILAQMEAALSELGLMDGKALGIIQQLKEYAARIARAEATIRDCGKELNLSYEETLWALNNDCRDTGRKNASAINRSRHAYQELRQAELETGRDLKQLKKDVQVAFAAYNDFEVAKKQLVEANLRLAFIIASKYAYGRQHLLDLIQEGNIGLMRAAEKFDHRFGCKFATYASWWVRQAITKYIDRYTNMIRIPANVKQLLKSVVDAAGRMQDAICPDSSMLEDDSEGQLSEQKIQRIVECLNQHPIVSLQMPVGDGGSELSDIIEDQDSLSPEKAAIRKDLIEKTRKVLSSLSPNEQRILEKRFGIGDEDESTLQEIGCEFGLTRERIRQIQADCLDRMRHPSRISELDSPEE
jgi:RNA polymerase primary sigma factor